MWYNFVLAGRLVEATSSFYQSLSISIFFSPTMWPMIESATVHQRHCSARRSNAKVSGSFYAHTATEQAACLLSKNTEKYCATSEGRTPVL